MKRGITPIIATVILLLIVTSMAGLGFTYLYGNFRSTSKVIQAEPASSLDNGITIWNMGTEAIKPNEITVYVNGKNAVIANPQAIMPGKSATVYFIPGTLVDQPNDIWELGPFELSANVRIIGPSNAVDFTTELGTEIIGNFLRNSGFEQGVNVAWKPVSTYFTNETLYPFAGSNAARVRGDMDVYSSDYIPYDPNTVLNIELYAKSNGTGGLRSRLYAGFMEYDKDKNFINHWSVHYWENTKTTLAANLNPGDTQVQLTSGANWRNYSAENPWYYRVIGFWNTGDYPDYTYTRTLGYYNTTSGNILILCSYSACSVPYSWTGPMIPAGTPVANMFSGSTYNYVAAAGVLVPTIWTKYSGTVTGWKYGADTAYSKFRYGTRYIKVNFLVNYAQDNTNITLLDEVRIWGESPTGIYSSCLNTLNNGGNTGDGVYTIDPDGPGGSDPVQVYCDMTTEGGGWTLVLLNSPYATPPKPNWSEVVNNNSMQGSMNSGLMAFDQFLGVKYWSMIGNTMRLETGTGPSGISHRATYTFSLNPAKNYSLSMSNERILVNTGGTASPGMFTYHAANNFQLTTYDADHDAYASGNCATFYTNTAWWYGSCWSGSFWGGGDADGYQNAPFWTSSGTEYFPWGAIWIR